MKHRITKCPVKRNKITRKQIPNFRKQFEVCGHFHNEHCNKERTPVIIPMVAMLFFVTSDNIMVNMLINAAPAKDNPTKIKAACPTVRLNGRNRTNCSIVSYPSNPYKKAIIPNMSRERSSVKPTPTVNPARVFAAYNFFFPRRVQRITWSVFSGMLHGKYR